MATSPAKKRSHGPLYLLLIAYVAFVGIGMIPGLLNIAWSYMEVSFNVTLASLGVLLFAKTIGGLIASFLNGQMIARIGVGSFLVSGGLLLCAGAASFAFAQSWEFLLFAAFLTALGSGVIDAGMNTFISEHYTTGQLNWLHACFGIGLTIGPLIVSFVVIQQNLAWQISYVVLLALQIAITLAFIITRSAWDQDEISAFADEHATHNADANIKTILRNPLVLLGLLLFLVYGGLEEGAGQLSNSLFTDSRGIDPQQSASWISFYWGSFTVGRILFGAVIDRIPNRLMMRTTMAGTIVGTGLLWWDPTPAFGFLGLAVLGFSLAPMFATLISETPKRVGRKQAANVIGFQIGFATLGISLLPGLGGLIADRGGLELIGPFLVVNAIAMFLVHEAILWRESHKLKRVSVAAD